MNRFLPTVRILILTVSQRTVSQCHSEEPFGQAQGKLGDEESAFFLWKRREKQILRFAQDDDIGVEWPLRNLQREREELRTRIYHRTRRGFLSEGMILP